MKTIFVLFTLIFAGRMASGAIAGAQSATPYACPTGLPGDVANAVKATLDGLCSSSKCKSASVTVTCLSNRGNSGFTVKHDLDEQGDDSCGKTFTKSCP
jgi:hypothetical protein